MTEPLDITDVLLPVLRQLPGIALFLFDADLRIRLVEGAALTEHGWDREAIIERELVDILPGPESADLLEHYRRALEGHSHRFEYASRDGGAFVIDVGPVRNRRGEIAGGLVVCHDVTRERAAEARYRGVLERSNEDLARVATVASHDLGTPVAALLRELEDLEPTAGVRRSRMLARGMQELIGAILAFAQAHQPVDEPAHVDLQRVFDETLIVCRPLIEEHRAQVASEGPLPSLPGEVVGLRQLMQNLVSNAILHHPGPNPQVRVRATEHGSTVRLEIADDGPGIDPARRAEVFALFGRGAASDGHGVGLAIAQRVVERHGGRIWVEDNVPRGTRFLCELPASR